MAVTEKHHQQHFIELWEHYLCLDRNEHSIEKNRSGSDIVCFYGFRYIILVIWYSFR